MYRKELDEILKSSIPRASFIYGECAFLIDYYSKKIKNKILDKGDVDIFSFYFNEYNKHEIINKLNEQSLFSTSTLVRIKSDSSKISNDISEFIKAVKDNSKSYLTIEFYGSESKTYIKDAKKISSKFDSENFINVRLFKPNQKEALDILVESAARYNTKISTINLMYLYEIQNYNIDICDNELKKLSILDKEITKDDIESLCYGLFTNTIDELCDALLSKREIIKILIKLEEEGVSDIEMINSMQNYFYRLFLFFASMKTSGIYKSKEILGYSIPKNIEDKYAQFATRLKENQYLEIFTLLNHWKLLCITGKNTNYMHQLIKIQAIVK